MPTTTNVTTTYAGKFAGQYIGSALLAQRSLDPSLGIFTVKPNIAHKQVVKTLSTTDTMITDASCDFTDTGVLTLNERVLEPKRLQINVETCKADFVDDWEAEQMGFSQFKKMPKKLSDFIVARLIARHMAKTEVDLYSGDASNGGEFSGVETLIAADANLPAAQEVAGTTVDASNVIDELGKIVDATPTRLRVQPDFQINVAPNVFYAYVRALGGFATGGLGANGVNGQGTTWASANMEESTFDGIRIVKANGMTANTAIATATSNLWFGTGLLADHNQVKLLDMADLDGSENVRFVARYSAGVQYGFAEDIVTYGITNAAN
jgi:hypothetical protein